MVCLPRRNFGNGKGIRGQWSHCFIKYSYYASQGVLKCNYCGRVKKYTGHCSKCGSSNLIHSGKGVERVEEEIKKYFDVRVIRVDSEMSKDREFFEKMYFDFLEKKYDIMVGTQLISKGFQRVECNKIQY